MKNVQFYTIAVLIADLPTPSYWQPKLLFTFYFASHVISCLREWHQQKNEALFKQILNSV